MLWGLDSYIVQCFQMGQKFCFSEGGGEWFWAVGSSSWIMFFLDLCLFMIFFAPSLQLTFLWHQSWFMEGNRTPFEKCEHWNFNREPILRSTSVSSIWGKTVTSGVSMVCRIFWEDLDLDSANTFLTPSLESQQRAFWGKTVSIVRSKITFQI